MPATAKKKILVVDDEQGFTLMIAAYLSHLGHPYELYRAFDKEKTLEILESKNPDVVCLDIDLYGVNSGLQILKIINERYPLIKTIVITGRAKDHKDQIHEIGCFYFFEKPVGGAELADKVQEALGIPKITSPVPQEILTQTPRAKLLFIVPYAALYAYFSSIFDSKELSEGEYTVKIIPDIASLLNAMIEFGPDFVLISDCAMENDHILEVIDIANGVGRVKPKAVIVHGLFEREASFENALKEKGAYHCIQNVMDNEQILKMNKKLSNFVGQLCAKNGLVK